MSYEKIHIFNKNKKIAMQNYNHKCAYCGNAATVVHHKDGSKSNHELDNLIPLCPSCHVKKHYEMGTYYLLRYRIYPQHISRHAYKPKVSLETTIPSELANALNEYVKTAGMSKSCVVEAAIKKYLDKIEKEEKYG